MYSSCRVLYVEIRSGRYGRTVLKFQDLCEYLEAVKVVSLKISAEQSVEVYSPCGVYSRLLILKYNF